MTLFSQILKMALLKTAVVGALVLSAPSAFAETDDNFRGRLLLVR